jgi:hypothetical protein
MGLGEGPRWFVTVSPGSVRISSTDIAKAHRAQNRGVRAHRLDIDQKVIARSGPSEPMSFEQELEHQGLDWRFAPLLADQAFSGQWHGPEKPAPDAVRIITEWSYKSRLNMTKVLVTLDYNDLVAQGDLAMMTLTYPDNWLALVPNGRVFKHHVDKLRQRFRKKYSRALAGVWKMEFQKRGAPHLHMLIALPSAMADFRLWVRAAWASIVDAPGLDRMKHETQGVNVDRPDRPMTDPKRIGVYFNKHGQWGSKEYQNRPPQEWIDAAENGLSVGRFWGYWKLERSEVPVLVSGGEAVAAARMLRRWQRHSRYTRDTTVARIDVRTGTLRYRKVKRKVTRMGSTAGFVSVNDGPTVAFMIERVILALGNDSVTPVSASS